MITESLGGFFKLNYRTKMFDGCTLQANPCREHRDLHHILQTKSRVLVISLTEPHEQKKSCVITPISKKEFENQGISYLNFPTTDILPLSNETFTRGVKQMRQMISNGGHVTVHCKAGVGRSACLVMAYLMTYGPLRKQIKPMTYEKAKKFCTAKRRQVMNKTQTLAIKSWVNKNKVEPRI